MKIQNLIKPQNKNITLLAVFVVVILVGVGFAHRYLWAFSPAYSQKQVSTGFFGDISRGDTVAAYKLTSNSYQSASSYAYFVSQVGKINNDKMTETFVAYAASKNVVAVTGYVNNKTINEKLNFTMNFVASSSGPRVDAIVITPST